MLGVLDVNATYLPVNPILKGDLQEQMNQGNTEVIELVTTIVRLLQQGTSIGLHCESGQQLLEIVEDAITHRVID